VNVICAQRLARKIHVDCIESYVPDEETTKALEREFVAANVDQNIVRIPRMLYRGKGCAACNFTGFLGRIGIFEAMNVTESVRKLIISSDFNLDNLRTTARQEGMITMFEDGLRKVEVGLTTLEEVLRVIRE
jgi:type IV pilus assembly protein PilB